MNTKKIQIIESNNEYIIDNKLFIPDIEGLKELKDYVLSQTNFDFSSEPEFFFQIMNWVSTRWKHDGLNPAETSSYEILINASKGKRYRCVEYGKVFSDILLSFGYIARSIGIQTNDLSYRDSGAGHVASEVWSNKLNKWVFIDPQCCIYALYQGEYLNFYDIYKIYKEGNYTKIDFIVSDEYYKFNPNDTKDKNDYINHYRDFLKDYFGYINITVISNENKFHLNLYLDGKEQFLTFQGGIFPNNSFTKDYEDLYFKMNQVMAIFDYQDVEKQRLKEIQNENKVTTLEELLEKKYLFYAKPNLIIKLINNIVWFSHYEVTVNGESQEISKNALELNLNEGISDICIKGINKYGVISPPINIKISYT